MDHEIVQRVSPFGEADCESEVRLLKQDYQEYFFYQTRFNHQALESKVYLIVGRRGAGKTALSQFFSFQKQMRHSTAIDVDEPAAFEQMLTKITNLGLPNREVAIPKIARVWNFIIWLIVFRELKDEDVRIRTACIFGDQGGKTAVFVRHVLKLLLERFTKTDDLLAGLEVLLADSRIKAGKTAVLEITRRKPVIIAFDTLENYTVSDSTIMWATAALIQAGSEFNQDYASRGLHLKIFAMAEVFPYVKEEAILNPLKSVRNEVYLHWRPKDLMRLICWRFFHYLDAKGQLSPDSVHIDWDNYDDVREKMWTPYFGNSLRNQDDMAELTFPYILRHTQMRPRQLIVLCNHIANRALHERTFPIFQPDMILRAVFDASRVLAEEVFNSYSSVYPRVGTIVEALSGLPMLFKGNELDKRAPLTASEWTDGEYSPNAFRRLVSELGVVGRVRYLNEQAGYVEADFEYSSESRLPLQVTDICVIHPMFYRKLNIQPSHRLRVYPFPEHEEFHQMAYRI